jgi:hypothetical protein
MEAFRGDFYGLRIKGWLVPPVSGAFRFWIAADDNGELWLSTDDDPTNIDLLCFQPDPSPQNDFFFYRQQQSELVTLVAGTHYYFEVSVICYFMLLYAHLPGYSCSNINYYESFTYMDPLV